MLKIATGQSRKAKKWKNKELSWEQLVERFKSPTITQETLKEYQRMDKPSQAEIKDVGGFVGGWLKSGRRKAGNVELRSILTLDVDSASKDLLELMDLVFDWKGVAYTTHSHTKKNPRYRLIFQLDREVDAEEYQAIGRYVASKIGMKQFDPTGFQPERLMYWPSHSRDGEFICQEFGHVVLKADEVLSTYPNWKDVSFWPLHPNETHAHTSTKEKMEDPTEKKGFIGAFCRAYSITEAIHEFLSDVYEEGSKPNRYTYLGGSTSDGLVIYDDLFAYSHHGTDPVSSQTVNAFDLVRLHLFGDLDESQRSDTKPTNRKSYKKMIELCQEDSKVNKEIVISQIASAEEDFEGFEAEEKLPPFRLTETGALKADPFNLEIILKFDKKVGSKLAFNEFTGVFEKTKKFPWEDEFSKQWTDSDTAQLKSYVNHNYGLLFGDDRISDCLIVVSQENTFNPVKEFIQKEEWDGKSRLYKLLIDYLGAEDSPYVRELTELWFGGAVSRIFNPGCKFDCVPVLEGAQGIGKSTFLAKIGGDWFTDALQKLDGNKDDLMLIGQNWIIELSELASLGRTKLDQAKGFISRTVDSYRPPYGRMPIDIKRHVVFMGTTNTSEFLKDVTGNRRWYPIFCTKSGQTKSIFDGSLEQNLGQIWAEAYELYKTKYKYGNYLVMSEAGELEAIEARKSAEAPDVTRDLVIEYLEIPKPKNWSIMSDEERRGYMEFAREGSVTEEWKEVDLEEQTEVSSREIYDMMFGTFSIVSGKTAEANSEIYKIGMVLGGLPEWEKTRFYDQGKRVRGFKKNGTLSKIVP